MAVRKLLVVNPDTGERSYVGFDDQTMELIHYDEMPAVATTNLHAADLIGETYRIPPIKVAVADFIGDLQGGGTTKGWRVQCAKCFKGIVYGGTHSDNLCKHCRKRRWARGDGSRGKRARRAGRRPGRNSGAR